jgi:hypothetical protein
MLFLKSVVRLYEFLSDALCKSIELYSLRGKYSHYFRKTAGTKIEISRLRKMIETSGFFFNVHTFAAEREVLKS